MVMIVGKRKERKSLKKKKRKRGKNSGEGEKTHMPFGVRPCLRHVLIGLLVGSNCRCCCCTCCCCCFGVVVAVLVVVASVARCFVLQHTLSL